MLSIIFLTNVMLCALYTYYRKGGVLATTGMSYVLPVGNLTHILGH